MFSKIVLVTIITYHALAQQCQISDYRTAVGADQYNVLSFASDVSTTTNDIAVGILTDL